MPQMPVTAHPHTTQRSLVLQVTASDASLHRIVTDLMRKRVLIEELHFESSTEPHRLHLVLRGTPDRLDHVTAVLANNIVVIAVATTPIAYQPATDPRTRRQPRTELPGP